jgi:hypothetical protein
LGVFDLQTTLIGCVDKGVKPAERLAPNYVRLKLARRLRAKFWHGRQRQLSVFAWLFAPVAPSHASLNKLSFEQRICIFLLKVYFRGGRCSERRKKFKLTLDKCSERNIDVFAYTLWGYTVNIYIYTLIMRFPNSNPKCR